MMPTSNANLLITKVLITKVLKLRTVRGFKLACLLGLLIGLQFLFANDVIAKNKAGSEFSHVFLWQVKAPITDAQMKQIKDYGVTTIQSFRLLDKSESDVMNYLDLALKHDLKVMVYLQIFVERIRGSQGCRLNDRGRELLDKYHQHPAIYAWHTLDEPAQHDWSKQCQQDLHDYIKSVNPELNVMISTNIFTQEHYDNYFQPTAMDIIDLHKYSNPNAKWKQVQMLELFELNSAEYDIELIITLRAFNAPHKKLRLDMTSTSLVDNYNKLVRNNTLTKNLGFYGWDLSSNLGIKESAYIRAQFLDVLDLHLSTMN